MEKKEKKSKLSQEEKDLLKSFGKGELKSVKNMAKEKAVAKKAASKSPY